MCGDTQHNWISRVPVLWSRRIWRWRWTQKAVALIGAKYFRFVFRTNRPVVPPEEFYARGTRPARHGDVAWPALSRLSSDARPTRARLVSHHSDGEMTTLTAERLGVEVIRGSGDPGGRFDRKGGIPAFLQMVDARAGLHDCAHRGRSQGRPQSQSWFGEARKPVRARYTIAGDQPAVCARQLGSHHHQPPVRTLGCRTGRARARAGADR